MSLLISLIVMTALAAVIRVPLKRAPWLFYLLAVAVSALALYFTLYPSPSPILRAMAFAVQKGQVGVALFVVVMFIGVFETQAPLRRYFNPVRAELSIVAALLMLAHFCLYLRNYLFVWTDPAAVKPNVLIALLLALVALALLIVLTVTSFDAVRRRMQPKVWKKLQKLAYVFFELIFLHLLGYHLPAALSGSPTALVNLTLYTALFCAYAVLRIRKALRDK